MEDLTDLMYGKRCERYGYNFVRTEGPFSYDRFVIDKQGYNSEGLRTCGMKMYVDMEFLAGMNNAELKKFELLLRDLRNYARGQNVF